MVLLEPLFEANSTPMPTHKTLLPRIFSIDHDSQTNDAMTRSPRVFKWIFHTLPQPTIKFPERFRSLSFHHHRHRAFQTTTPDPKLQTEYYRVTALDHSKSTANHLKISTTVPNPLRRTTERCASKALSNAFATVAVRNTQKFPNNSSSVEAEAVGISGTSLAMNPVGYAKTVSSKSNSR